jgi:hypothetical protein
MVGTGIQTPRQYTWQEITKKILTEFLRISNGFLNKFEKKNVRFIPGTPQLSPHTQQTKLRRKVHKGKKKLGSIVTMTVIALFD